MRSLGLVLALLSRCFALTVKHLWNQENKEHKNIDFFFLLQLTEREGSKKEREGRMWKITGWGGGRKKIRKEKEEKKKESGKVERVD